MGHCGRLEKEVEGRREIELIYIRMPSAKNGPHTMVAVVRLCQVIEGELTLSHEGTALRYRPIDEVRHWHARHETYTRAAYAAWKSERPLPAVSD